MIHITDAVAIDESEIREGFIRASGPGGRNVNSVASAVQIRFDVRRSPSLPEGVRERLVRLAGRRMTKDGVLVINARRYRTQARNRQDAITRLAELVRSAAVAPKQRRQTGPTGKAKMRRLEAKRRRAKTKRLRRPITRADY